MSEDKKRLGGISITKKSKEERLCCTKLNQDVVMYWW